MKLLGYGLVFTVVSGIAMATGVADPGLTVLAILVLWGLLEQIPLTLHHSLHGGSTRGPRPG